MILKRISRPPKKKNITKKILFIYLYTTLTILTVLIILFINTGVWQNHKNDVIQRIHLNGIYNYKHAPQILKNILVNKITKLDTLYLDIDQENIIKIEKNRFEKIKNNKIDYIQARATIRFKGDNLKTNIRLKGDRAIHYEVKERSSYRFKLKKNNYYKGMNSFSVQKPRIRNYIWEWIFHEFNYELNSIKLKYEFINLKINGSKKGLYVIEELFSNNLLEKNGRRAGPIFGLNENFSTMFDESKLDAYQEKYWNNELNKEIFLIAKAKILKIKDRDLPLNQIFDIEKWANYFAICDVLGTPHGFLAKSVKMYYNPITGLIEPIPFDGHKLPHFNYHQSVKNIYNQTILSAYDYSQKKDNWLKYFFLNKDNTINKLFYLEYLKGLKKVTDKKFLDNFFKKNMSQINLINSKIYLDREFKPDYNSMVKSGIGIYFFDKQDIYHRANFLIDKFAFNKALLNIEDKDHEIQITNLSNENQRSEIIRINCQINIEGKKINRLIKLKKDIKFGNNYLSKKKLGLENSRCKTAVFKDKINNKIYELKIDFSNLREISKINYNYLKFFKNDKNNILTLNQDLVEINDNLYIPNGYKVLISPGQKIILKNNSFIFSKSNWIVDGEINNPVIITGNKNNFGGGLFINSHEHNIFKNVIISYLNGADMYSSYKNRLIRTSIKKDKSNNYIKNIIEDKDYQNNLNNHRIFGAINFYETITELDNVTFFNISAEDAINIVSSNFILNKISFLDILSDAIDTDYSNGKIRNIKFENVFNDSLDFSESIVDVSNISANNVGDKVISSGENSIINVNNIVIQNSFIGVANKDGSKTTIINANFKNTTIPFAAYKKKNAYDDGHMSITNAILKNYKSKFMLSKFSSLEIDNKIINKNYLNADILKIVNENNKELIINYQ